MAESSTRLRNYLTEELDECTDADIDQRVEQLTSFSCHLGASELESDIEVFSALANETRYTVLRTLHAADEELCVCEINVAVDASEATISQALSTLVEAGLVTRRKDGRWRKYRATNRAVALLTVLDGLRWTDA